MKKYYLILAGFLLVIGCSRDNNSPVEEEVDANLAPTDFNLEINNITHNSAILEWDAAIDPENDMVSYDIYLNEILIISDITELQYRFSELTELTSYSGKVIAKDTNDNEIQKTFEFQTDKYYLKFLKTFDYGNPQYSQRGSPYSMIKSSDNNYIIAGSSNPNGNGLQFFVLKVDYEGNEIWRKFYPYQLSASWRFKIIESSTGLILVGHHHVLNLDDNGNIIWYKKIDSYDIPDNSAEIKSVAQDSQGNIFVAGGRGSNESEIVQEAVITKLDNFGNIIWEKNFTPSIRSFFNDLLITESNQLLILGSTETDGITYKQHIYGSPPEQIDFWVLKLTNEGEEIWSNTYGDGRYDFPEKIIKRSNGNYVFAGFGWGAYDISVGRIFEIDQNGNELLNVSNGLSTTFSIAETMDNGLVITGHVDFGNYGALGIFKFDSNGNEEWNRQYQESFTYLRGQSIITEDDGGFRIVGSLAKNYYNGDERPKFLIYKTDPEGSYQ